MIMKKQEAKRYARVLVESTKGLEGKALDAVVLAFIEILRERGHAGAIRQILAALDGVWRETYGASSIHVASAHPLSRKARDVLTKLAPGAEFREEVDPALIAGARVRIDDTVLDATLTGHLATLQRLLLA